MNSKTPEEYARELIRLYSENNAEINTPKSNAKSDFKDGTGGLQVNVTTVQKLYPVKSATVTVFYGTPQNRTVIDISLTDINGKSKVFVLDTADAIESQSSNTDNTPFSVYNLSVFADGYIEQIIMNVPIFSKTVSIQSVDLLPVSAAGNHKNPQIINDGNHYNL